MEHRQVGNGIRTHQPCLQLPSVGEHDGGRHGVLHHMGVGDDVAVGGEHHAGAAGGAGAGLGGDGDDRRNIFFINFLQRQAVGAGVVIETRRGGAQLHLGGVGLALDLGLGGLGGGSFLRGDLADLQGILLRLGENFPDLVEKAHAQHAQQAQQAEEEDKDDQHRSAAAAPPLRRLRPARLIYPGYPGFIEFVSVHK